MNHQFYLTQFEYQAEQLFICTTRKKYSKRDQPARYLIEIILKVKEKRFSEYMVTCKTRSLT